MKDPAEEWRQLHALYTEMGDIELLELKASFDDLTDMAQNELRDELKRRQLWEAPLPQTEPVAPDQVEPETAYDSYGNLRLGGVTVGEYDTQNDAGLAAYVLDLEGIEAVVGDGSGRFDLRLPFVRVAPEDVEKATVILARPISEQTKADYEQLRTLPDFEVPGCPHCSCTEVLLEEVEPTNRWLCGECGHRWQDGAAEDAKAE